MEYSIQQLSELAGVSTRTLRWYHKLNLLEPSRIEENGYRKYDSEGVDRLQQILFYRALGVELAAIKQILDNPSFDRMEALHGHLKALQEEETRIQTLIQTVSNTIDATERNEIMSDSAKFAAFKKKAVEDNENKYGTEIREKYGEGTVKQSNATMLSLSQGDYDEMTALNDEILTLLAQEVTNSGDPEGETGKAIVQKHKAWLAFTLPTSKYSPQLHCGLALMYTDDPRFTQYYDKQVSGCAQYLRTAIECWSEHV